MSGKPDYLVDGQVLKVRLAGDYTAAEFLEIIKRAFETPEMPEKVALLIDGSHTNVERTQGEYQRIIEAFVALADRIICFAYVTLSAKLLDIIQQAASYAEYNSLGGVKPFPDKESAEKWIKDQLKS